MTSITSEVNEWYETLRNQRLEENDKASAVWNKYKSDLQVTKSLLSLLPKKVSHKVMVPIGQRALMPGRIVHTNEFLVNLGETWFAKRTASQTHEICDRRIRKCDDMIEKLKKERELIVNKSDLPSQQEAFGSEERPEIIEYVTEEENEEWKKRHRIKEKEYRQKLAQLRAQEKKQIQTEEDLWKHLDELELQEELEDELNRLNEENKDYSDSISSDEDSENSKTSGFELNVSNPIHPSPNNESSTSEKTKTDENCLEDKNTLTDDTRKRKVSFVCDLKTTEEDETCEEPLRLLINFSNHESAVKNPNDSTIQSPSDIYENYMKSFSQSTTPVPVLKSKVNPNREKELEKFERERLSATSESDDDDDDSDNEVKAEKPKSFQGLLFKDVMERNPFTLPTSENVEGTSKKVSKFKASRKKVT